MGNLRKDIRKDNTSVKTKKDGSGAIVHKAHILSLKEVEQNRSKAYQYIF